MIRFMVETRSKKKPKRERERRVCKQARMIRSVVVEANYATCVDERDTPRENEREERMCEREGEISPA